MKSWQSKEVQARRAIEEQGFVADGSTWTKRTVNAAQSKPIGQTSGHNNVIPESRRLLHIHSRAIKSP
jgi:hypothetical protein